MNDDNDWLSGFAAGFAPESEEDEQSLVRKLASSLITPLQYVGESLDKVGAATRGAISNVAKGDIGGAGKQLLNAIPFSDFLGLTSEHGLLGNTALNALKEEDRVTGRDLIEQFGYEKNTPGLDWGDVLGFGVEVATDPLTFVTAGLSQGGKALKNAGLLQNAFVQAKRAGKAVKGQSGARHALKTREILAQGGDEAGGKFLNALFKGKSGGRTMADVPADLLDDSVGGLFNFMGHTVRNRRIADKLDDYTGWLRYGNPAGRALNNLFDRGHVGASRAEQEFITPNRMLYQQQEADLFNPQIANIKGVVADSQDMMANANPFNVQPDKVNRVWEAFEGIGPDPAGLNPLYQDVASSMKSRQNAAGIPTSELSDDIAEIAFRRMLDTPHDDLTIMRRPYTKNTPRGTVDIREIAKAKGHLLEAAHEAQKQIGILDDQIRVGQLTAEAAAPEMQRLNQIIAQSQGEGLVEALRDAVPDLGTYNTTAGNDAVKQLESLQKSIAERSRQPGTIISPEEQKALAEQIQSLELQKRLGTNLDRYEALANSMKDQSLESLKAGGYMDPVSSLELVGRSHANRVGAAKAFQDVAQRPEQWGEIVRSSGNAAMVPLEKAAESLGLDAKLLQGLPGSVPEAVVDLFKPKPMVPAATGPLSDLAKWFKDYTTLTKAHLTGTILNPSFPTRNRFSGAATNVLQGNTSPLSALKGFFQSLTGAAPAQLLAKGKAIPGAAQMPWVQEAAAKYGVDLADDDAIATNLIRTIHAGVSGGHQGRHIAENILDDMTGVGDFVGGRVGPTGPDAFSYGKVLNEAKGVFSQPLSEQILGAAGIGGRTEPTSALLKSGATLNNYVESQNRIAPWLDMVSRGIDPAEAMRRVDQSQVSYHPKDYTDFENNVARFAVPFYKFLKGSTKNVANELSQKPGGALSHFIQASGDTNDDNEILPDYVREKASIPVGSLPAWMQGLLQVPETADFKRYITGLGLAHESPLSFVTGERGGLPFNTQTLQEGLSQLNPLLKSIGELTTGQSFFQRDVAGGRPLEDLDPPFSRLMTNIYQMTTGNKADPKTIMPESLLQSQKVVESILSNSPFAGYLSDLKTLSDQRENTRLKKIVNFATGLRLSDVPETGVDARLSKMIDEMRRKLPGSKIRTDVYVPEERRNNFNKEQEATYEELRKLDSLLRKRQRKSKKKEPLDLEALLSL